MVEQKRRKVSENPYCRPLISVLPFRSDVYGLRVLLELDEAGAHKLISSRGGAYGAMHLEAKELAESNAKLVGAIVKRPLSGMRSQAEQEPVIFAFHVHEELPRPRDDYEWVSAAIAIGLLPEAAGEALRKLGGRVRVLPQPGPDKTAASSWAAGAPHLRP